MKDTLPKLDFPPFEFKTRKNGEKTEIFDIVRKKYVALTPEEWVRQHVVHYLHFCRNYPLEILQVEGSITLNGLSKRCDIVAYDKSLKPLLLVECKRASVPVTQKTFDQISRYDLVLKVPYLLISNGLQHFCFSLDKSGNRFAYHAEIPDWKELNSPERCNKKTENP